MEDKTHTHTHTHESWLSLCNGEHDAETTLACRAAYLPRTTLENAPFGSTLQRKENGAGSTLVVAEDKTRELSLGHGVIPPSSFKKGNLIYNRPLSYLS